jgi:hypothetical protein
MARSRFLSSPRCLAVLGVALATTGCGMRPLPEDVSGVTTFDIVERIRCEAQEGLRSFDDDDAWRIAGATTIGLGFNFNMSAGKNAGISDLNFDRVTSKRHFDLDADASSSFDRRNIRAFQVVDKLVEVHGYDCTGKLTRPNLAHPVTGSIGLSEVIRTYVQLEKQTNLRKASDTIFSDSLEYSTNYQAGFDAIWEKNAVAGRLTLTKLSVGAGAHRDDIHTLHVTLTRDPVGPVGSGAAQKARLRELIESENIRDPRSQVALVQKESGARTRTLLELERLRVLNDDDRVAARVLGQRMLDLLKLP